MKKILTDGTFYIDNEFNSDDVFVLIHGNGHDHSTYHKLIDFLNTSNKRVIAYDLYGHGQSNRYNEYNLDLFVNQLNSLLGNLKVDDITLVGHSLGAHIALQCLNLNAKVKQAVVYGIPPISSKLLDIPFFNPIPEFATFMNPSASDEEIQLLVKRFMLSISSDELDSHIMMSKNTCSIFKESFFSSIDFTNYQDEVEIIKNHKVLFLHGESDQIVNLEYIKATKLDFKLIPKSAHSIHIDNSSMLGEVLIKF